MDKYYECEDCKRRFETPHIWKTTYESYYGAPIDSHTPLNIEVCPYCKSLYIEELDIEDEERSE